MADLIGRSARDIRDEVALRRTSAVDVCRAFLDRIEAVNPALNAFNLVDAEGALARAARVDRAISAGEPAGPLAGVPVALKDNLCTEGMRTTASSRSSRTSSRRMMRRSFGVSSRRAR